MKHKKNKAVIAAWLSALLLACPLTGCGSDSSSQAEADSAQSGQNDESSQAEKQDDSSADSDDSSSEDREKPESSENASGHEDKNGNSKSDSSQDDTPQQTQPSDSGTPGATGSQKTTAKNAQTSKTTASTAAGNSNPEDSDLDPNDEDKPTKYIYLNGSSAKFSGDGISVKGSKIYITKGGDYEISGTLDNGQIYIETEKKKVRLHLNNCSITNKAGSAIFCQQAKKTTIYSVAGTKNYISDGGTHDADNGAIFSEDTLVFKGEGEISITGVYAHGVQSDDDILMKGGTVNIQAAKSCLHSNDGIEIWDGTLYCNGGTNGIKTDGDILISGGYSTFIGGVREEKGSVYCDGSFTVTGGTFYAIGNTCTAPDAATTTANLIGIVFGSSQAANTQVEVVSGSNTILSMTSDRNFRSVYYSGANLLKNAKYQVNAGGKDCGSFTAGNAVTVYTVS